MYGKSVALPPVYFQTCNDGGANKSAPRNMCFTYVSPPTHSHNVLSMVTWSQNADLCQNVTTKLLIAVAKVTLFFM